MGLQMIGLPGRFGARPSDVANLHRRTPQVSVMPAAELSYLGIASADQNSCRQVLAIVGNERAGDLELQLAPRTVRFSGL